MRAPSTHPLARTYALLDAEFAASVADLLSGTTERAEVEGLVELILNPESGATAVLAALQSLEHDPSPLVNDTIVRALNSPHPSVRIAAINEVVRRQLFAEARDELSACLTQDSFWQVRRAAVNALATTAEGRLLVLAAANDPHWRVRYALVQQMEEWGRDAAQREAVLSMCATGSPSYWHREIRLSDYLIYRWTGELPTDRPAIDPHEWCSFWDWDDAVLARNLEQLGRAGRRNALHSLVRLINHSDERVRAWVILALREDGTAEQWAGAIGLLGDPREDTAPVLELLTRGIELERIEAIAKFILRRRLTAQALDGTPEFLDTLPWYSPAFALRWALAQVGEAFPAEEVQEELEHHKSFILPPTTTAARPFPPDHPYARAELLTPQRAKELIDNPTLETSWFVLARAAQMCRVPLWNLAPEQRWKPPAQPREPIEQLALPPLTLVQPRQLSPDGPVVSPLGVSGHYGLPVKGFVRAAEAGVNLFFWEPNYATLTRFMTRLSPTDRREAHILAGTFEASPAKIRKDVDRVLRNLKLERLSIFLIFWTRSWQRITPDVREVLERLKSDGLVQVFGLSTHDRTLARDAILDGWNPVMVRHSAAHRKAEVEVFPHAIERGTSILTFNNTCYGRLLDPSFRPSDCFRYTLNTPGVSACFTAPATVEYLEENLDALRNPELAEEVRAKLLQRGEWMYREDTVFRKTVRAEG